MGFFIIMSSLLGVAFYVGFSLLKSAKKDYHFIRRARKTPTTLIRYLENGFFEFSGEISKDSQTIIAPLSNEPCVWYRLIINEVTKSGKHRHYKLILDHVEEGTCIIEDESMSCQIGLSTEEIEMNLKVDNHEHTPTEDRREVLEKFDICPNNGHGKPRHFTFTETKLCVGDTLYAIGDIDVSEKEDQSKVVTSNSNPNRPEQKLYLSDQSEINLHKELQLSVLSRGISGTLIFIVGTIFCILMINIYLIT
jgi:hypothetical protein